MYFKYIVNNAWEKFFVLTLVIGLFAVLINFALLMGQTVPRSKELIPPNCKYDEGWFFIPSKSDSITTSIKTGTNQSLTQFFMNNAGMSRSVYVSQNNEIWTVNAITSKIYITSTLGLNIVDILNLGTLNCFNPAYIAYDSRAYKNQGQVWVSCVNSSKILVFNPSLYSMNATINNPTDIIGSLAVGQISMGPNYAFVTYGTNRWVAFSTKGPVFPVVSSGYTPGGSIYNILTTWRSNLHLTSNAYLYVSTSQNKIFKYSWNGLFTILDSSNAPSPVISMIQDITTSPDETFLYAITPDTSSLLVYYTVNMTEVAGSGSASSVQLPTPTSIALGLYQKTWQMVVTQSNGDVSSLISINKKTGLPYNPSNFTYVQTGNDCVNAVYYAQECPCAFC